MTKHHDTGTLAAILGAITLAVAAIACCAAPLLIASGALAVIGGLVRNGWVIGTAAAVLLAALAYTVYHRRSRHHGQQSPHCDPPTHPNTGDQHRVNGERS